MASALNIIIPLGTLFKGLLASSKASSDLLSCYLVLGVIPLIQNIRLSSGELPLAGAQDINLELEVFYF